MHVSVVDHSHAHTQQYDMSAQQVFSYLLRSTVPLDDDWDRLRVALRARDIPGAELRASAAAAARRALRIVAYAHLRAVAETTGQPVEFACGALDRLYLDGRAAEAYDALCAGLQASTDDDEYVRALLDPLAALLTAPAFRHARQRLVRIVKDEVRAAHVRATAYSYVTAAYATCVHTRPRRSSRVNFEL